MTKRNDYLIIPRSVFYDYDKNKYLTPEELYIFAWLYRHRLYSGDGEWMTMFSVDGISQRVRLKAINGKDDSRNKAKIKEILITLYNKGYIKSNEVIDNNIPYQQLLDIYYPRYPAYDDKITYQMFDQFENEPSEFFIYACIDRLGDRGRNLSLKSWEKITSHKKKKILEIFDKMNSDDYHTRIWKFSGDYYKDENGELKQEVNEYYTRPDDSIKKLWYQINKKKSNKEKAAIEKGIGLNKGGIPIVWGAEDPFDHHASLQYTTIEEEVTESKSIPQREHRDVYDILKEARDVNELL